MTIDFAQFLAVDIRVGTIISAEPNTAAAKPALKLVVDFGPEIGHRKTSAQIAALYDPAELPGRQVLAVVNFPPKQIGKSVSEVLVLGLPDEAGRIVLLAPDRPVPDGGRMF